MMIPDLIEPVPILIQQINKAQTPYSIGVSGRREIINHVTRNATIELPAQVIFGNTDQKPRYSQAGTDEQSAGYFVFRYADLEAQGVKITRGDKIIKIGQIDIELFFMHSVGDPAAQISSVGFTLVRMFFMDRIPLDLNMTSK